MPNKLPGVAALVQAENEGRIKSPDDLGRMAESYEDPQTVLDDIRRARNRLAPWVLALGLGVLAGVLIALLTV